MGESDSNAEFGSARSHKGLRWRPWPCPLCASGLTPLGYLGRRLGASSPVSRDEPEKCSAIEVRLLQEWVVSCEHTRFAELVFPKIAEGSEHAVFLSAEDALVFKATLSHTFGESYYLVEGIVHQRNCTPLDYLNRLHLWKKLFRSAPKALGITSAGQIVSEQRYVEGITPSQEDVDAFLHESGLSPVKQECFLWKKGFSDREIWLGDARDENFVETRRGIVPIDIRMWSSSQA